ncbi:DegT/DnrJ/EryC1/StrS family aminotransferase [Streptomyces sp. AA0539]|uniref:DegT/DnrJ/EryC1/StrS family aminotransferase n=1 Tax=Streptomyces sp. AA0539 TaxID=1210045 RepID=UPI000300E559|nr:DegT/DnrJ/EryC1/StrS family aminotransferase [Streptomyces sp. AA0539]
MSELPATSGPQQGWRQQWPAWPARNQESEDNALRCLGSGRWAVSGPRLDGPGFEETFAAEFADFIGVEHCVPTANGTSALLIALEALGIGAGDEVIVPGLTWVASASTVMAVNALPVIVDVDPGTLCIDPEAVRAAIGPRTRAVSVVHLYSSVCDLDALRKLCERHSLALIEDCAQAHGAEWRGRKVGGWGEAAAFSMQQMKLLTAGEGGAATTQDPALHRRMYQLRSDGRARTTAPRAGEMELSMTGEVMGSNYCMSELTAAVLSGQLRALPEQNSERAANAEVLDSLLATIPGVSPARALPQVTRRTYYYYIFRIDRSAFAGHAAETVVAALRSATAAPFQTVYPALPRHPLLRPSTKRRYAAIPGIEKITETELPAAEAAQLEWVSLHHSALLAGAAAMGRLAEALAWTQRHAGDLAVADTSSVNLL